MAISAAPARGKVTHKPVEAIRHPLWSQAADGCRCGGGGDPGFAVGESAQPRFLHAERGELFVDAVVATGRQHCEVPGAQGRPQTEDGSAESGVRHLW